MGFTKLFKYIYRKRAEQTSDERKIQARWFTVAEISFIALPFLALLIAFLSVNKFTEFLEVPEWSLASAVMFGQSIIKLIYSIGKRAEMNDKIYIYDIGAFISFVILIGLVPSLVTLALIITLPELPTWILILQLSLFVTGIIIFSIANHTLAISEIDLENHKSEIATHQSHAD